MHGVIKVLSEQECLAYTFKSAVKWLSIIFDSLHQVYIKAPLEKATQLIVRCVKDIDMEGDDIASS